MASSKIEAPSAAFFNPQSKAADVGYLDSLQQYLHGYEQLSPFVEAIRSLPQVWETLASHNCQLTASSQGQLSAKALAKWIETSDSSTIANGMSGSLTLPLLTIIQMSQYFQFLQVKDVKHHELLRLLGRGGVHGYCGGLLPAVAVAVSANEGELVRNASKALHLALVIGTYGDLGDDDLPGAPTNMVLRLKHSGQGENIVQNYPGVSTFSVSNDIAQRLKDTTGIYIRHHRPKNHQHRRTRSCTRADQSLHQDSGPAFSRRPYPWESS